MAFFITEELISPPLVFVVGTKTVGARSVKVEQEIKCYFYTFAHIKEIFLQRKHNGFFGYKLNFALFFYSQRKEKGMFHLSSFKEVEK